MPKRTPLRLLTEEEVGSLKGISCSQKEPPRRVIRAKMILALHEGYEAKEVARQLNVGRSTVENRRRRFNCEGLAALNDRARQGRPHIYDEDQRRQMVVTAKTHPQQLGLELSYWTLDTLVDYVNDQLHIPISRSQLGVMLKQRGLKWYQMETNYSKGI